MMRAENPTSLCLVEVVVFILCLSAPNFAAQNFIVLHTFESGSDGDVPQATLTADENGNLYGVTMEGDNGDCLDPFNECGVVFELSPTSVGKWSYRVLYNFLGGSDGARPTGGLTRDNLGNLYGTTFWGGTGCGGLGCGIVFELVHQPAGTWHEVVLYRFSGGSDGAHPASMLAFDKLGNIYGTTAYGGDTNCYYYGPGCGVVFKLHRMQGGKWIETVFHTFEGSDGADPFAGVVADSSGNLYGTTQSGGNGAGVIYQLKLSGNLWNETIIYNFDGYTEAGVPEGELILDKRGNVYGVTKFFGYYGAGSVFELSPSNGAWSLQFLHSFSGLDGWFPSAGVIADARGNLYGTAGGGMFGTCQDGCGVVYKLDRSQGWSETILHTFSGGTDGFYPWARPVLHGGKLYGTAAFGGDNSCQSNEFGFPGCGVVFQISP